jgi:uncharacterized protein YdhG (YjbR/CyaY superfamily)
MAVRFATIDEYIASYPPDVRVILEKIRRTILAAAPGTDETISYGIPTVTLDGRYLIYFAGWKRHISVYPIPDGDAALQQDLAPYKHARGTLRFPLTKPIPYELIERVVVAAMRARAANARTPNET